MQTRTLVAVLAAASMLLAGCSSGPEAPEAAQAPTEQADPTGSATSPTEAATDGAPEPMPTDAPTTEPPREDAPVAEPEEKSPTARSLGRKVGAPYRLEHLKRHDRYDRKQRRGIIGEFTKDAYTADIYRGQVLHGTIQVTVFADTVTSETRRTLVRQLEDEVGNQRRGIRIAGQPAIYVKGSPSVVTHHNDVFMVVMLGGPYKHLRRIVTQVLTTEA